VKHKKDGIELGDNFISREQSVLLFEHVAHMLRRAALEISQGNIECAPFFKSVNDNACVFCDYSSVCGFDTELGDFPRITRAMKTEDVWRELGS
jgi:ATP-dependent helicase/nuclease subunit B